MGTIRSIVSGGKRMKEALWTAGGAAILIGCMWFASAPRAAECGTASWYSYTGRLGADGQLYTGREMTAAHKSLPFGTRVRVTDQRTGRSIVVRISDRGPFVRGRIIDLSPTAKRALGMGGLAKVCISTAG